jgi:UDP-GlcNAc3NAcA epimerase
VPRSDPAPTLALCFGTRPQVIKASVLLDVFRSRWSVMALDTGQHYDYELNELLYQQLRIPRPDHFLEVGSDTPADQVAKVITRTAEVLRAHTPAVVVVIGDTNSTLGCAIAATKEALPLVHVESGLRSSEPNLPEESNRRVVDALSDLLCAPSALSAARLHSERVPGTIVTTGDVARDVLLRHLELAPPYESSSTFALVTMHRAALTDDPGALSAVLAALGRLPMRVVFAVHPRTRLALERHNLLNSVPASVSLQQPMGYLDMIAMVQQAAVVVTDSGGLQREAYWLGVPCVTLRGETEWLETVESGANALVVPGSAGETLAAAVMSQRRRKEENPWSPEAYGDGHAAERIADAIEARFGVGRTREPAVR